jgi:hypothetical protein
MARAGDTEQPLGLASMLVLSGMMTTHSEPSACALFRLANSRRVTRCSGDLVSDVSAPV